MNAPLMAVVPTNVSEQPAPASAAKQGAAAGCSEALLKCCALALTYHARLRVYDREHADTLVARALWGRTQEQALRWRQFSFTASWPIRWRWAVGVLREFYPELPGVREIPEDHEQAPLPEVATATVTPPPRSEP